MEGTTWGSGTGLDRIRQLLAAAELDRTAPYDVLGLRFAAAEKGRVEFAWTPGAGVLNRGGVVHGGYISAALDEAGGVAAISLSEPATPFLTMSLNVDFLRPLLPGLSYAVVGTVLQSGRLRTLVHSTITDDLGRLCAQGTAALTPNRKLLDSLSGDAG